MTQATVVATAIRLVEDNDLDALTMRRLAAELGTAVTSIYWHVGNRDALVGLMVDRLLADMRDVTVGGRDPRARISSLCKQWRQRLWDHPHLIALAHERNKTLAMFQPMQAALARELHAVGLRGKDAAAAIRGLQLHVVSSVVIERTAQRGPTTDATDPTAWPAITDDPELIAALSAPVDYRAAFDVGLEALLDRFL
ncbi:MAG TPA: helix-turn-helix domain-containing protein [Mycobacteriales bacterium]|nr:helix-turn-helix domain-containing protein [Mycobacteriales bacterium]